jgi:glutathione synthase/RimK-type ligase-like ATP-grasp enzyme
MMTKELNHIKLVILRNELDKDHLRWVVACEKFEGRLSFQIVDVTKNDWLDRILVFKPDLILTRPGGLTAPFKQLYDERLMILSKELNFRCFPSLDEVLIYENKRYFSYWLRAHKIPHPKTDVFYFKDEAISFLDNADFPLVGKVNIGASGSGVVILKSYNQAKIYVNNTFSGKGAEKRVGPNLNKSGLLKRGIRYLLQPGRISQKMSIYNRLSKDRQIGFVIIQEYVPHPYEWRVVRIGDSFFAHKKMKLGDKASGSLLKNYDNPPHEILDFVKEITDKFDFHSQAVDIFETEKGYLVNEMQCIFGQSDPYQMLVDGRPGRYCYKNANWIFEEGDFNTNESYDLRLSSVLKDIDKEK